jgi:hypothetical protein
MDKKQMEELMKTRVVPVVDRQIVKEVDLLKPRTTDQKYQDIPERAKPTNNQTAEAVNISADKAPSIQATVNENMEAGRRRGRPKSTTEGLVHFSTWLPEELAWAIRAKAVELHKKDYEVVTEAIEAYLESLK